MTASKREVGGDHYRKFAIQPAEFCHRNGLGFIESCVIKYLCRHKAKNGRQDIEKAIHYLELLMEWEYPNAPTDSLAPAPPGMPDDVGGDAVYCNGHVPRCPNCEEDD